MPIDQFKSREKMVRHHLMYHLWLECQELSCVIRLDVFVYYQMTNTVRQKLATIVHDILFIKFEEIVHSIKRWICALMFCSCTWAQFLYSSLTLFKQLTNKRTKNIHKHNNYFKGEVHVQHSYVLFENDCVFVQGKYLLIYW